MTVNVERVKVNILKGENVVVTIDNVIKLALGYKLIYIEYIDNEAVCIRAFGRREFDEVEVIETGAYAKYPLKGEEFAKQTFYFDNKIEPVDEEETDGETT